MSQGLILIVDDVPHCRRILSVFLSDAGYSCDVAESARVALDKLKDKPYDLVICDIKMPDTDGIKLLARIKEFDHSIAVVMVTGFATVDTAIQALKLGASDYITKPFNSEHVLISAERALERRHLILENKRYQKTLEQQVQERTSQLEQALKDLQKGYLLTHQANRDTVTVLSKAAEINDEDTGMHIKRVGGYVSAIATCIGLDFDAVETLGYSAECHDVGKVATHPDILCKPGKLTDEEFAEMKKHTSLGAQILDGVEFLKTAKEIALNHHERYNGRGYPNGLVAEEIPLSARITAIADVFDALTSDRCYRAAMPVEKALGMIREQRSEDFDPKVHDAFFDVLDEILELKEIYKDE